MNPELATFCHRLVGALINGSCAGVAVGALVWLGLKLLPNTNAATRHGIYLGALLAVALLPAADFIRPAPIQPEPAQAGKKAMPTRPETQTPSPGRAAFHRSPVLSFGNADPEELAASETARRFSKDKESATSISSQFGSPNPTVSHSSEGEMNFVVSVRKSPSTRPSLEAKGQPATRPAPAHRSRARRGILSEWWAAMRSWGWRLQIPSQAALILAALWAVCVALRLGGLARQIHSLNALKRRGKQPPEAWLKRFELLRAEMGLRRRPRLLSTSSTGGVPLAAGFLCPAILLPSDLFKSGQDDQIGQILRHELAHLDRGDDWITILQQGIQALLFFNPVVGWLSSRLSLEREIACDDHVLAATARPKAYARFLVDFAGRTQARTWRAATAGWRSRSQLNERIRMILNPNRNASPQLDRRRAGVLTGVAILAALLALGVAPRVAFGEAPGTNGPAGGSSGRNTLATNPAASASASSDTAPASGPQTASAEGESNASAGAAAVSVSAPAPEAPAPRPAVAPAPPPGPKPPAPPTSNAESGSSSASAAPSSQPSLESIDRRLDRLERMVEKLMMREKESSPDAAARDQRYHDRSGHNSVVQYGREKGASSEPSVNGSYETAKAKPSKEELKRALKRKLFSDKEVAEIQEEVRSAVAHAMRQANAAVIEAKRAASAAIQMQQDALTKLLNAERQAARQHETPQEERQQLEAQRERLKQQLQKIEKQLDQLHPQSMQKEMEGSSKKPSDGAESNSAKSENPPSQSQ